MNLRAGETFRITVNGQARHVETQPGRRLSDVLRRNLSLTGTKSGCDAGDCGACTVLLDGAPVCACLTPLAQAAGRQVLTVEGLGATQAHAALQDSFLRHGAAQCGICTPGMLMAAVALLSRTATPSRAEAEAALGGVLCRCTGYAKIIDAVCDVRMDAPAAPMPAPGAAVGARLPRLDGRPKVTGGELFGGDFRCEAPLTVLAIRSPHPAARFTLGDTATWAADRSAQVFTAADIPGENRFGVIPPFADQPALAEGEVRLRGEAVALVAAPRRWPRRSISPASR
ncbi:2Fe-2S iron-sulfur cluster-binding protein [Pseudooceanicola sp. LIPI14-2-Ac024]|uniref:(2Fe-2S)-binding protein n=1 Tax=Pseudooceanicola sp. LIPI14-2-Ac024 TaxID=3344875 RepID=UPI0035D06954